MFIQIQINTGEPLSEQDERILEAIHSNGGETGGAVIQMADAKRAQAKAAPAQEAPEESTKAPKASRTRKAAAKATAPPPEPQEDATDSDDEDLLGDDEPSIDDAVARATALVEVGKGSAVKAALKLVGATKVREMTGDQIERFLSAVEDADQ